MPESELVVSDSKQKFTSTVKLRCSLWETMVGEVTMDQEIKRQIIEILRKFRDQGLTAWDSLDLAFTSTIEALETINVTWKANTSVPLVQALFQNIKQDLHDLQTELQAPVA